MRRFGERMPMPIEDAMKIYIAGRSSLHSDTAPHLIVVSKAKPPHELESYYYIKRATKIERIRQRGAKIFLDSGAYSMQTQGVKIDPEDYARFILRHQDVIEVTANLDVIGGADAGADSYANLKKLEGWLKPEGLVVLPVHHVRDSDYWLQRYIDEGYPYIGLGGMVSESTPVLRDWLDHIWYKYLTNRDGTPKVKVHGFGLTTRQLMFRYPFTRWIPHHG